MTIGEIADRTITALARSWQPLLLTLIAAEFPAQVFSFAGVMRTREMYGSGIAVLAIFAGIAAFALSLALGPAQIALVNGADDMRTFMEAMRYGFRNFWLSLRCALLLVFTLGIAGGVVGGIAGGAAAAGGGRTAFFAILLIGGALLVPLYLVANLTLPIALFETGRATPAFGSAWRRSIGTDVRRSWLLGFSLGLVGQAPSYVVGFLGGILTSMTHVLWVGHVLTGIVSPLSSLATVAFATIVARDLRVRAEGADLEDVLDDNAAR